MNLNRLEQSGLNLEDINKTGTPGADLAVNPFYLV